VAFFCRLAEPAFAGMTGSLGRYAVLIDERHAVPKLLLAQIGVSVGLAALLWLGRDGTAAASALLGGMIAVIPNAFLAARLLSSARDANAGALLRAAWIGEIGKLLLTAVLFGVVFAFVRPLSALSVFGGFIAAQLVVFGALLGNRGATGKS